MSEPSLRPRPGGLLRVPRRKMPWPAASRGVVLVGPLTSRRRRGWDVAVARMLTCSFSSLFCKGCLCLVTVLHLCCAALWAHSTRARRAEPARRVLPPCLDGLCSPAVRRDSAYLKSPPPSWLDPSPSPARSPRCRRALMLLAARLSSSTAATARGVRSLRGRHTVAPVRAMAEGSYTYK